MEIEGNFVTSLFANGLAVLKGLESSAIFTSEE
jgi:hypothetical protein